MNSKLVLPFLELMPTQVCNLSCDGCTNYSDMVHKGYLSWDEGKKQILPWLKVFEIPDFGIIGGEPLLVPDIIDWIYGVREIMPHSQIRFTTNGTLLSRHADILQAFFDIGNCVFKISMHADDEQTQKFVDKTFVDYKWIPVNEHGINRYKSDNGVRFQLNRPQTFIKPYHGKGYGSMRPHNSDPEQAFDICIQQTCPLLYQGKIYKCSSNGLLRDLLNKTNTPYRHEWDSYLRDGITVDSPYQDLVQFVNNFGKAESVCAMCPTAQDTQSLIPHYNQSGTKKKQ